MPEFHGTIDDLKAGVEATDIDGTWSERPNYCWKFTSKDRAGLNWASRTGKIWFDGPDAPKKQLADAVEAVLGVGAPKADDNRTIFVVHGHDPVAREQLERALSQARARQARSAIALRDRETSE
jgi:hypothetical protein